MWDLSLSFSVIIITSISTVNAGPLGSRDKTITDSNGAIID